MSEQIKETAMTDIQKMIEEARNEAYHKEVSCLSITDEEFQGYRDGYDKGLDKGIDIALSQLQHANRWRKVSEELPEKGIQVLVRNKYGVCHVTHLLINGWDYVFEFPPVEWKPIK